MTLATESPRVVTAARRAVEYLDEHAPLLEADAVNPYSSLHERPSLLAYNRPTWRSLAPPAAPLAKTRYAPSPPPYGAGRESRISTASSSSVDDAARFSEDRMSWYTSDEDSPVYFHGGSSRRAAAGHTVRPSHAAFDGLEEEESKDDDAADRRQQEDAYDEDDDDAEIDLLEAPRGADVPLLETDEEEPEQEVDTILGDLTRLPARTTIIDEDGFLVDPRASLSHPAAAGEMGLGVTRPGMVIKAGLLFKQGFGFLNGGWKVRHVELTSAKLSFFKGEHGRKRGEIDLATCSPKSIEIMPRDSVFDGSQATMWRFAIKTKGRRVLMSAYSEADMKEWLRCLHVALAVQSSGAGRFTDVVVPNGTLLANKGDGLMRASGSGLLR